MPQVNWSRQPLRHGLYYNNTPPHSPPLSTMRRLVLRNFGAFYKTPASHDHFYQWHAAFHTKVSRLFNFNPQSMLPYIYDRKSRHCSRRRRCRDRDAEDVEGKKYGEGVSGSPADYGIRGRVVRSFSGIRGRPLAENGLGAF